MNTRTALLPLVAVFALSSCSSNTSPSGFLSNYSQLGRGDDKTNSVAAYFNPKATFENYDSIMFEPVVTIVDAELVDAVAAEQLAAYVDEALRTEFGKTFKMVDTAGPTTLRIRTALTDIIEGRPASLPVSRAYARPRASLSGKLGSQEVATFVADVSFEAEVLDSVSGRRLAATSDQRYGAKREVTASTDWSEIRAIAYQGGARFRVRMLALH